MTEDRIEGLARQGLGHIQDAVGGLAGDVRTQARGKFNEAAGVAQETLGQAREQMSGLWSEAQNYAKEKPAAAMGIALGLGVVLGLTMLGGRKTN